MRYTPKGQPVTSFGLLTPHQGQRGRPARGESWFQVVAWGALAEACRKVLTEGQRAYVEGHVQTRRWTGRADHQSHVRTEVVAQRVIPLGTTHIAEPVENARDTMPPGLNLGLLIGMVGHDPELLHQPDGSPLACFSLAVSRRWTTTEGEQQEAIEWFSVITQGVLAETSHTRVSKGQHVYVEGEMRIADYTGLDTATHASTELWADGLIELDSDRAGDAAHHRPGAPEPTTTADRI